ncbi:MAG: glycosyltransferase family 2 protein [Saprospiraceae bacterium]|nr:glycosyltransferase family 2 protein [Saprospiraceae bacterium]
MLSVLIPIYNQDITHLVKAIQEQMLHLDLQGQIICLDDASSIDWKEKNRLLRQEPLVVYEELSKNVGRAVIRNCLADRAQEDFLLFLDGDSKILDLNFIATYWGQRSTNAVIVGGRRYPEKCLGNEFMLHYTYGRLREQFAQEFQSNNFLISSEIFQKIRFDESLKTYGHEDTVFGFCLLKEGHEIIRISNPVEHVMLDTNTQFLEHQVDAVRNLIYIRQKYPTLKTRLTGLVERLDQWRLSTLYGRVFRKVQPLLIRNLLGKNPSLTFLDLYKIGTYLMFR